MTDEWDQYKVKSSSDEWDEYKVKKSNEIQQSPELLPSHQSDIGLTSSRQETMSLGEAVKKGAKKLPSGIIKFGKQLVSPETYEGIGDVSRLATPMGWMGLYIEGKDPVEMIKGLGPGIANDFLDKYGSWDKFKIALASRPEEVMADASAILMGGGGLIPKAGKLGQVANVVSKTGQALDPLTGPAKGIGWLGKGTRQLVSPSLGVTTSRGEAVIEDAIKGGKDFRSAMSGKIPGEDIVAISKGGVSKIAQRRESEYLARMDQIERMPNPSVMDLTPVLEEFTTQLKNFDIRLKTDPFSGKIMGLDFSRSPLKTNKLAKGDFENLLETFRDAFDDPTFYQTPKGMDNLKKSLSNFYHEGGQARNAVSDLYKKVRQELVDKVPGYESMVGEYEKTTTLMNDITNTLSLKKKTSPDTALRKLNTAMREDDTFRRSLIDVLEKETGKDISAMISGRLMRPVWGSGLGSKGIEIGGLFGVILGNPSLGILAASASPRIVGETLSILAKTKKPLGWLKNVTPEKREIIYQSGKLPEIQQADQP